MLFKSKGKELRLVKIPSTYVFDANGNTVIKPGKTIQFINHTYSTNDPEIIEWLLNHPARKIEFDVVPEEVLNYAKEHAEEIKQEISINKDEIVNEVINVVLDAVKPILEKQEAMIRRPKKVWFCADCKQTFTSPLTLRRHRDATGHGKSTKTESKVESESVGENA